MNDWNGEWWAESLEGKDREAYIELVAKLLAASKKELPMVAREMFQMGHKHGYDLGCNLCTEY